MVLIQLYEIVVLSHVNTRCDVLRLFFFSNFCKGLWRFWDAKFVHMLFVC